MITQADIARAAGVSIYTVSCALRGQVQVAEKTRARILKLAEEMGYHPDAAATLLAEKRHKPRKEPRSVRLGIFRALDDRLWGDYFIEEAEKIGYAAEIIEWEPKITGKRLAGRLVQRSISGIVFNPGSGSTDSRPWMDIDFSPFSVVKISPARVELSFHIVRLSAFAYTRKCLECVFSRGYKRVAVILTPSASIEDDDARVGAILSYRELRLQPEQSLVYRIFPFEINKSIPKFREYGDEIFNWAKSSGADALVGFPWIWINALEAAGYACPRDISFAAMLGPSPRAQRPDISGIDSSVRAQVSASVHELHRLISIGEKGVTKRPTHQVILPEWVVGTTLPDRKSTGKI